MGANQINGTPRKLQPNQIASDYHALQGMPPKYYYTMQPLILVHRSHNLVASTVSSFGTVLVRFFNLLPFIRERIKRLAQRKCSLLVAGRWQRVAHHSASFWSG
jgi:hypothetical protein